MITCKERPYWTQWFYRYSLMPLLNCLQGALGSLLSFLFFQLWVLISFAVSVFYIKNVHSTRLVLQIGPQDYYHVDNWMIVSCYLLLTVCLFCCVLLQRCLRLKLQGNNPKIVIFCKENIVKFFVDLGNSKSTWMRSTTGARNQWSLNIYSSMIKEEICRWGLCYKLLYVYMLYQCPYRPTNNSINF